MPLLSFFLFCLCQSGWQRMQADDAQAAAEIARQAARTGETDAACTALHCMARHTSVYVSDLFAPGQGVLASYLPSRQSLNASIDE